MTDAALELARDGALLRPMAAGASMERIEAALIHLAPGSAGHRIFGLGGLRPLLDEVPPGNAPLMVALGSHSLGRIPEAEIDGIVAKSRILECTARRGDVWAYATLILHASEAAREPRHRRVLQIDYSADRLPAPLEWLGA